MLLFGFLFLVIAFLGFILALHGSELVEELAGDNAMIMLSLTPASRTVVCVLTSVVLLYGIRELAALTCFWRYCVKRSLRRLRNRELILAREQRIFLLENRIQQQASANSKTGRLRHARNFASTYSGVLGCRAAWQRLRRAYRRGKMWWKFRLGMHGTHYAYKSWATETFEFCIQLVNLDRYAWAGFDRPFLFVYGILIMLNMLVAPLLLLAGTQYERVVVASVFDLVCEVVYSFYPIVYVFFQFDFTTSETLCRSEITMTYSACRTQQLAPGYDMLGSAAEALWGTETAWKLLLRLLPCYFLIYKVQKLRVHRETQKETRRLQVRHTAVVAFTGALKARLAARRAGSSASATARGGGGGGGAGAGGGEETAAAAAAGEEAKETTSEGSSSLRAKSIVQVAATVRSTARQSMAILRLGASRVINETAEIDPLAEAASDFLAGRQRRLPLGFAVFSWIIGTAFGLTILVRLWTLECDMTLPVLGGSLGGNQTDRWGVNSEKSGCTKQSFLVLRPPSETACTCFSYYWGAAQETEANTTAGFGALVVSEIFASPYLRQLFVRAHGVNNTGLRVLFAQASNLQILDVDTRTPESTKARPWSNQLTELPTQPMASAEILTVRFDFPHWSPVARPTGWPVLSAQARLLELYLAGFNQTEAPLPPAWHRGDGMQFTVEVTLKYNLVSSEDLVGVVLGLPRLQIVDWANEAGTVGRMPAQISKDLTERISLTEVWHLSGTIPEHLNYVLVDSLHLRNLRVSGTIPSGVGIRKGQLQIRNNVLLSGTVPASIWNSGIETQFYIDGNPLISGSIPEQLAAPKSKNDAVSVHVGSTSLSGVVSAKTLSQMTAKDGSGPSKRRFSLGFQNTKISGVLAGPGGLLGDHAPRIGWLNVASSRISGNWLDETWDLVAPREGCADFGESKAACLAAGCGWNKGRLSRLSTDSQGRISSCFTHSTYLNVSNTKLEGAVTRPFPRRSLTLAMGGTKLRGLVQDLVGNTTSTDINTLSLSMAPGFSGTLPQQFAELCAKLEVLDLAGTRVSGPVGRLSPLVAAAGANVGGGLVKLDLSSTLLEGRIQDLLLTTATAAAAAAAAAVADQQQTQTTAAAVRVPPLEQLLLVSATKISGTLPADVMSRFAKLRSLNITGTRISGVVPPLPALAAV